MTTCFSSKDRSFRLEISDDALNAMLDACQKSFPKETGGILIGLYNNELTTAFVRLATPPTPDSRGGPRSFYRGIAGLRELLHRLWWRPPQERRYYLGEWHFHPGAPAVPSARDHQQMQEFAESKGLKCPEPALVIVGGNPVAGHCLATWIFRRGSNPVELQREI